MVGIPIGTNCASLLADIFLYSYEAEFIQSLLSAGKKQLASQFNFTYRYIDDVCQPIFQIFRIILVRFIPLSLRQKTRRLRATPLLPTWIHIFVLLSVGRDGQLRTYDKRDDFNFHITIFPFLSSKISSSPAYGVFISQLTWYARACSSYKCYIQRAARLSCKFLGQGMSGNV